MINQQFIYKHWSILLIILLTPLLLWGTILILPTHDDWTSLTTPHFEPFFIKEHFLFYGYHWRPFDTWIGYIVGRNPQLLYPAFNHICVIIGHTLCTWLIYRLLNILKFNPISCNITTLFFFLAPATMATVLAVDSQNQVFASVWGIVAFLYYIKNHKAKYILWPVIIFITTLSKENGLMWTLICPILAYGFDFIDKKTLKKDIIIGIAIMIVYALAIILLPKNIIIHPDYVPEDAKIIKNVIKFLYSSFFIVDYIYLLHQPNRNLLLAGITLLLTIPFLYYVFIRKMQLFIQRKAVCTLICLIIAVGPHLITVYSMMHTYAGLSFVCILFANAINDYKNHTKKLIYTYCLFIITAIGIDIHLWKASYDSGLIGKRMAQEAISKTGSPVDHVNIIIIEDDYPKLSSFCVIPNDAFGWGRAAQYETNYQWPKTVKDTTIERSEDAIIKAKELGVEMLKRKQYDCVWIVNHDYIDVIKK